MRLRKILVLLVIALLVSCNQTPYPIADARLNDFALYDSEGDFHRLSSYNDSKGIVLLVQGNGCPIVRNSLEEYKELYKAYTNKGFKFFYINSNIQDDREAISKEYHDFKLEIPVLVDESQLVADALDITITAEAFILHPTKRSILYRGPISDQLDYEGIRDKASNLFLKKALDAVLKNKVPKSKPEFSRGCKVTRLEDVSNESITYTQNVAPILKNYCVRCHQKNGIAPWAMTDFNTIKGWSAMIEQVLLSQRMPPWKADPLVGDFKNSYALPDSLRRQLVSWINDGLKYGSGKDPLLNFVMEDTIQMVSKIPDTTIILEKEYIPASGKLPYKHQRVKLNLDSDKWLAGVSIEPSNKQVVHHASLANNTNVKLAVNRPSREWIDNLMCVIVGGTSYSNLYPQGSGLFLGRNDSLYLQTHYTPIGVEQENITKVHLYYHDSIPDNQFYSLGVFNDDFVIDPFSKKTIVTSQDVITEDILIHSIFPHMHYRGQSIKLKAILPNGTEKMLISSPDFNFNWQYNYQYAEPIAVPKGTILHLEGVYNNSYQNPFNPDPSQSVTFGYQSSNEMLLGVVNYTLQD